MDNIRLAVVGQSGTGKSVFLRCWIKEYMRNWPKKKILLFNINDEHNKYLKSLGFNTLSINHTNYNLDWQRLLQKHGFISVECEDLNTKETSQLINHVCKAVYSDYNILLAFDEAHIFGPRNKTPEWLGRIIRAGRKLGIDVVFATQIIIDLDLSILKQCNQIASFRLTEENDIEKAKTFIGSKYPLESLSTGEFIYKNMKTGNVFLQSTKNLHSIDDML